MAIPERTTTISPEAPSRDDDQPRRSPKDDREPPQEQIHAVAENPPQEQEKSREEEEAAARTAQRKNRVKRVAPIVALIAVVGALLWWLHARQYEDTDDAQVDGHISQLGPRIGGYVSKVYVEDNQEVKPGEPLVEI